MRLACWFSHLAKTNLFYSQRNSCRHLHRTSRIPNACQRFFAFVAIGFSFSREGHEPCHVHVEQAERYAKFWLDPIELVETRGFRGSELRELYSIIEEHRDKFIIAWDEHFGQ